MKESYAIGIDLGATNIRAVIGDKNGNFIIRKSEKTVRKGNKTAIANQIIKIIKEMLSEVKLSSERMRGIGIASIGPLDLKKGRIIKPANLPFEEIPLKEPIVKKLKLPVYVLNDGTTSVIGEKFFGAGKNVKNLVYITLSSGIGGGAYVDDHLLIGKDGNAVEIGHIVIDYEGKLKCGCGRRGHWEAYCSGENIPKFVKLFLKEKKIKYAWLSKKITAKQIYDAAKRNDKLALQIVEEIGRLNAIGIANVINVYDPSLITIGGAIALNNRELVLKPIKKYVKEFTINRLPKIMITPLKEDVGLYGALAMVFNKILI
jgi:glucokinase